MKNKSDISETEILRKRDFSDFWFFSLSGTASDLIEKKEVCGLQIRNS